MRQARQARAVACSLALLATLASLLFPDAAAPTSRASAAQVFVGRVKASSAHIAFSVLGTDVIAYACDGNAKKATISAWFHGSLDGTTIDLRSKKGALLHATRSQSGFSGTLTLPGGKPLTFTATGATGKARFIFLAVPPAKARQGPWGAGWIWLADGSVRGTPVEGRFGIECRGLWAEVLMAEGADSRNHTAATANQLADAATQYTKECLK